ncbi:MAG TPA: flagellar basal body rod protein FlgC, partial [Limnochordia bacterium]
MGLFAAIDIAASGLTAQRVRLDTISNNLANAETTRTEAGGPYRRQVPVFAARQNETTRFVIPRPAFARADEAAPLSAGWGVRVVAVLPDPSPPRLVYDPHHPDADASGYVAMPNVNPVTEMVDLISATRAYEANVTVITAAKAMAQR